jgi:hypothetical protein
MSTPLLWNFTVPVGREWSCAATVAVMVTACPKVDGFGALINTVVVGINVAGVRLKTVPSLWLPPAWVVP